MVEISQIEITEVLDHVKKRHGHDFLNYSEASMKRRITRFMGMCQIDNSFELKTQLINDPQVFAKFIDEIPVMHTEMFRDAAFYQSLKKDVFPYLSTYPYPKIWHAACATGEEVYSTAIFLSEAQLLPRCRIYATDINAKGLNTATSGTYPLRDLEPSHKNYQLAGGTGSLDSYYTVDGKNMKMNESFRNRMVFSFHNLVTDSSFNEFHLILCRNVLIYFNLELQNKVLRLLYDSLAPNGYLVLGNRESMHGSALKKEYRLIDEEARIYQKKGA